MNDVTTPLTLETLAPEVARQGRKLDEMFDLMKNTIPKPEVPEEIIEAPIDGLGAANHLMLKIDSIYTKCRNNELPHARLGRKLYFFKSELNEYIRTGKVATNQETEEKALEYLKSKK